MDKINYKQINVEELNKPTLSKITKDIYDIEKEHYGYEQDAITKQIIEEEIINYLKKGYRYFLVYVNNKPAGRARININEKQVFLDHILVKPKYQNKNLGTKLMIRLLGYAKKNKFNNILYFVVNGKMHKISEKIISRKNERAKYWHTKTMQDTLAGIFLEKLKNKRRLGR